jgi:antitoxin (DNA-binding transcriptional repressor) of toxin-antitoxin stability system
MTMTTVTLTISKGKLKARMLEIFREIEQSGQELIVTDNGKPVLKIVPILPKKTVEEVFGDLFGKVVIHEDINTPTIDEWEDA